MFWLFLLRTVDINIDGGVLLKNLFVKFAGSLQTINNKQVMESVFEIIDESILIGIFITEDEILNILTFSTNIYSRLFEMLQQNMVEHKMNELVKTMETSAAIISVYETIFIKFIQSNMNPNLTKAIRPSIEFLFKQLIPIIPFKDLEFSSRFNAMLIAMISRLLIRDPHGMLELVQSLGFNLEQLIGGWVNKMDYIGNHYGRKLNVLAIMTLMPFLSIGVLQGYLKKLLEYVIPFVHNYISTKLSSQRAVLKTRDALRKQKMRQEDQLVNIELDAYFYNKFSQMCKTNNLTYEQIKDLLKEDENLVTMFEEINK
jgi:hypothetical protein